MGEFVVKKFDGSYKDEVEELSESACVPLLSEDYENVFLLFEDDSFCGFVFMRMFNGFAEMNGPVLRKVFPEEEMKKLLKEVVRMLCKNYPDTVFYVLTDYPEYFEKLGCKVAFDIPHEILLKAKPS